MERGANVLRKGQVKRGEESYRSGKGEEEGRSSWYGCGRSECYGPRRMR